MVSPASRYMARALENRIRAMDNPPPFESITLANERIDDIDFDAQCSERIVVSGYRRTPDALTGN